MKAFGPISREVRRQMVIAGSGSLERGKRQMQVESSGVVDSLMKMWLTMRRRRRK